MSALSFSDLEGSHQEVLRVLVSFSSFLALMNTGKSTWGHLPLTSLLKVTFHCNFSSLYFNQPPEVLTKDSVTIAVDAVVYYRIYNATISVANVSWHIGKSRKVLNCVPGFQRSPQHKALGSNNTSKHAWNETTSWDSRWSRIHHGEHEGTSSYELATKINCTTRLTFTPSPMHGESSWNESR